MPEDLLELEQPVADEPEGEQPIEGAEGEGEQPTAAEGEQPKEGEEEKPVVTSLFEPDGKKLAKPIRDSLLKLKAENPSIGKLVFDAVNRVAELRREFPGGIAEARELRDKVEQLGGFTDIEAKLQLSTELAGLTEAFEKGDPAFVEDMVASNPESFAALAPVVADRWREVNAEGWQAYIGRIVYQDLQANDVPLYLMRLADVVKDKPEAVELLNSVNAYLGGFKTLASKAPATKVAPKQPAANNNENQRELDLRAREWSMEDQGTQASLRNSAYTKALDGRTPNTEEKAVIKEWFLTKSAKLADQHFKDWRKVSQGYIARNDKSGYLRYMGSIHRRVIPEAVSSAVAVGMRGSKAVAKKPAAGGAQKTAIKATDGFTVVAKEPSTYDVDYSRTTQALLRENKAILKDGKKVMWR